jgi:hypothetical protein
MAKILEFLARKADAMQRNDPCGWHKMMAKHLGEAARYQRDRVDAFRASGMAKALAELNVGGGMQLPDLLKELGAFHAAEPAQLPPGSPGQTISRDATERPWSGTGGPHPLSPTSVQTTSPVNRPPHGQEPSGAGSKYKE